MITPRFRGASAIKSTASMWLRIVGMEETVRMARTVALSIRLDVRQ